MNTEIAPDGAGLLSSLIGLGHSQPKKWDLRCRVIKLCAHAGGGHPRGRDPSMPNVSSHLLGLLRLVRVD